MEAPEPLVPDRGSVPGRPGPSLVALGEQVRPLALAAELVLPVSGELARTLPDGGLRRGSVITVEGAPGSGATSVALAMVAAATTTGQWAAWVEPGPEPSLGAVAAHEAGIALERLAVVSNVPTGRWAAVAAALVEAATVVVAALPENVRRADARRLEARVRERRSVLVVSTTPGSRWCGRATLRLLVTGSSWFIPTERGHLTRHALHLEVEHRGAPVRRVAVGM